MSIFFTKDVKDTFTTDAIFIAAADTIPSLEHLAGLLARAVAVKQREQTASTANTLPAAEPFDAVAKAVEPSKISVVK